jgi:putative DNA primase/helicase
MNSDELALPATVQFRYTEFADRYAVDPVRIDSTWSEFCERFSNADRDRGKLSASEYHSLSSKSPEEKAKRAQEKDGAAWSPALYRSDGKRRNEDVTHLSAFVCDIDSGEIDFDAVQDRLAGRTYLLHTTYSHLSDQPKLRVIIPFRDPFPTSKLPQVFDHFSELFDDKLDPCSKKAAQMFYKPSCPHDAEFRTVVGVGRFVMLGQIKRARNERKGPRKMGTGCKTTEALPPPCHDGERHDTASSAIGRWLAQGLARDQIATLLREWNETNHEKWPDEKMVGLLDGMIATDQRKHPDRHQPRPWEDLEIPPGFELSHLGVWQKPKHEKDSSTLLAGPVWLSARTRDADNDNWGHFIEWIDDDRRGHGTAIPAQRFHEVGSSVVQELASGGLFVMPGRERNLLQYLASFRTSQRLTSVERLGWLVSPLDELAYMFPDGVQAKLDVATRFVYQPEKYSPTASTIREAGSLAQWQNEVLLPLRHNPLLVFSACIGFAGPLLKPAQLESGGFHFFGASSRGKTTLAQVAASIYGCGADPAEAPNKAYIQRWNTTLNGLEGLAAAHNDGVLILDELQTCAAHDFRKVIYNLAGGQGKSAMNASRNLRPPRNWELLFISTGEISIEQKIKEENNTISPGQRLRLLDIPVGENLIVNSNGQKPEEFVTGIKRACAENFGTAGRTFVRNLTEHFSSYSDLQRTVQARLEEAVNSLPSAGLEPEAKRAQKRFALVQVAGELAVELGVLPIEHAEVRAAVRAARDAWMEGLGHLSDATRGIEALTEFLLRYHSRFKSAILDDKTTIINESFGYVDTKEHWYLMTKEAFSQATKGHDPKQVCRELLRRGHLVVNEAPRFTYKKYISELNVRPRFYAIRFRMLEADTTDTWDHRDSGTTKTDTDT